MRTSTGHAVISGLLVVLICWPAAAPAPSRAGEVERVFFPLFDQDMRTSPPPPPILPGISIPAPLSNQPPPPRIDVVSLLKAPPTYPSQSITSKEQGWVVFWAHCDDGGRIIDAKIDASSGHDRLDTALLEAARTHRWRCGFIGKDGKLPGIWLHAAYRFKLVSTAGIWRALNDEYSLVTE